MLYNVSHTKANRFGIKEKNMAKTVAQARRDQTFTVMARIHREMQMAKEESFKQADILQLRKSLLANIDQLQTERDRNACRIMLEAVLHNQSAYDQTLVYVYQGKRYSVRRGTPNCEPNRTDYLHNLCLSSAEWDAMEKFSVWQHSGEIYCRTTI